MAAGCGRCGNLDIAVECPDCGGKIRSEPVPLCGECNELIHEGIMKEHRVETLDAKRKRSDFKERLESFNNIKPKVKFQLIQLNKAKKDVESRLQNNLYNIQQSFLEVGKVFKKKEQEFLLQLRTDASSKMTMLQEWHEMLTEHQKNLEQAAVEGDNLHRASPTDFLEGLQAASTQMQELSEKVIDLKQPTINAAVSLETTHLADQVLKLQLKSGSDMKSAPTFTKEIVPLVPPKEGDTLRAYVEGRMDAKGHFWLCPDFVDSVANILDDLSFEIRWKLIKEGQSPVEVKEGMFCVAEFEEDSRWYRAKVERVDKNKRTAQVKWMDYAHLNEVPLSNIQPLAEEFKDTPFQALECCLLENFEGSLPREARWEFSDLTGQNCLDCTILRKIDRGDEELPLYVMKLILPDEGVDITEKIKSKVSAGMKEKGSIGCRDVRLLSKEEGGIKELHNEKIEVYSDVVNRKSTDSKPTTDTKEAETTEEKNSEEKKTEETKTEEKKVETDEREDASEEKDKKTEKTDGVKDGNKDDDKTAETKDKVVDKDETQVKSKTSEEEKTKEGEPETAATCNGVSMDITPEDGKSSSGTEKITILTRDKDAAPSKSDTAELKSKTGKSEGEKTKVNSESAETPKTTSDQNVSVPPPQPIRRGREKPPAVPDFPEKEEVDSLATMLKRQQQDGRSAIPDRGGFGGGLMNPYMTPNMAMVNPALQQIYGNNQPSKPTSQLYPYGQGQRIDHLVPGSKTQANMYELSPGDVLNIRVSSGLAEDGTFLALKIRGPDEEGRFRHLMKEISMETDPILTEDVAPGKLMCAYYSTLNQWSRAHIIDVQDSVAYVWFCDFGTTETVPSNHIRFLELRHHLFPFQSAEYSIANKEYSYFPRETQDTFRNLTTDKIIRATVVDPGRPKPQVSLSYLNELRENINILKELISRGLSPSSQQSQEQKTGRQQPEQQGPSQQYPPQQHRNMDPGPQYAAGPYQSRSQDVRNVGQGRNYNSYGGDTRDGYYRGAGGGGGGGGMQQQKPKGGGGQWSKQKGRNQRKGRYN